MDGALFVDVGNLNVLFKENGKFCLGTNYLRCPEKLVIDAQSLGSSFDVYLSMWPRRMGEGDTMIPSLSVGGVPFVVLRDEVKAAFSLVENIPGVNSVFLCNAAANFVIPSRVGNFKSVIPYGQRFAMLTVEDRILSSLDVFDNQQDFFEQMGEDFNCYGDLDIIDVETIRAQYPELEFFKKNVLIPLVPLIASYRSAYKVTKEEALEQMENPVIERKRKEPVKEEPKELPLPEPEEVPNPARRPAKQKAPKQPLDFVSLGLGAVLCVSMLVNGVCFSMRSISADTSRYASLAATNQTQMYRYDDAIRVYQSTNNLAAFMAEVLEYAHANEQSITITAADSDIDRIYLVCNCQNEEDMQNFVSYMQRQFVTDVPNEMDRISNGDGAITIQYGLTVIPD